MMMARKITGFMFPLAFALFLLTGGIARAEGGAAPVAPRSPLDLTLIDVGRVKEIKKSNLIVLANDTAYALANLRVPIYYEQDVRQFLKDEILGQTVGIYLDKRGDEFPADRYGNKLVHVVKEDGTWVQGKAVSSGMAWVETTPETAALAGPLYTYESNAIKMQSGFWSNPEYRIKTKDDDMAGKYLKTYQVYEGTIEMMAKDGDNIIFYCDKNAAKGDFAFVFFVPATIAVKLRKSPADPGATGKAPDSNVFDMNMWTGTVIRVRGWVEELGRQPSRVYQNPTQYPGMKITHTEQMQVVGGG